MPPIAANGDWILTVLVTDAVGFGPEGSCSCDSADIHFTVTGGTADTQGPQVEAFTTSPAPVTVGEPFDLTIRLSDEHLAPDYSVSTFEYYSNDPFQVCTRASDRSVSPTEHEWTFRCPPPDETRHLFRGHLRSGRHGLRDQRARQLQRGRGDLSAHRRLSRFGRFEELLHLAENGETPAVAGASFRRAGEIRTPDLLTPSQAR